MSHTHSPFQRLYWALGAFLFLAIIATLQPDLFTEIGLVWFAALRFAGTGESGSALGGSGSEGQPPASPSSAS